MVESLGRPISSVELPLTPFNVDQQLLHRVFGNCQIILEYWDNILLTLNMILYCLYLGIPLQTCSDGGR
jgi:hypothetical protein